MSVPQVVSGSAEGLREGGGRAGARPGARRNSRLSEAPPGVVRWLLRCATLLVLVTATWIGIQLALAAPQESPTMISVVQD